ncbi:hypothetical protein P7K49_020399 [Saguinus oedipus]|uniref:Uncharacterized protein n=1 Tax=Saguinus oedipus TaxID=9490 RepID=A0ABQ9V0G2_SAGOE|nr:hypothetical protein P7K49_020399 [Saguinus oedipus]
MSRDNPCSCTPSPTGPPLLQLSHQTPRPQTESRFSKVKIVSRPSPIKSAYGGESGNDAAAKFSRQQQTLRLQLVPTFYRGLLMKQPIHPFPSAT